MTATASEDQLFVHHPSAHTKMQVRRERVTAHPLQSRGNSPLVPDQIVARRKPQSPCEEGSMSSYSSLTTINTASLIQSAARSVLDSVYTPTSTNVSDDENDDDEGHASMRSQYEAPTLDSLKREALPALPGEDDRKRFVGCLAAVLASCHDYDVADEEDEKHANKAESYAYLNRREQEHDSDEAEDELDDNYHPTTQKAAVDSSLVEDDLDPYSLPHNCTTSFEYADASQSIDLSFSMLDPEQRESKKSQAKKEKNIRKSIQARNRHRKRRYDVLSSLLLSSAELLLLDKSQARAFLPMLAQVLMPPSASQKAREDGLRQQSTQLNQKENIQRQQQQCQTPDRGDASTAVESSPAKALSNSNSPSRSVASSLAAKNDEDKGINRYHFSPSKSIPISRRIPLAKEGQGESTQGNDRDDKKDSIPGYMDEEDHLRPFLESLSPGAGYRCLSLLLLQHLLCSSEGYDARIRHVIKKLGVIVLVHDMEIERDLEMEMAMDPPKSNNTTQPKKTSRRSKLKCTEEDVVAAATRKFEALEHSIAVRLIRLSKEQQREQNQENPSNQNNQQRKRRSRDDASALALSREQWVRGLKIGSAGLVAGTIFAVTGGLAAPGIAAGVAAFAGSTAATAAVAALVSSTPAVTAIFGVGGGSLAAYKMNRRTQGLTEFEFRRQDKLLVDRVYNKEEKEEEQAELFSTVCISGWLRDQHDFQRPWGVAPSNPRIRNRLELLERFYSVYRPDHVGKCKKILASWKGEETKLWDLLRQKYGRDPDHLYPIASTESSDFHQGLTLEQEEVLTDLFVELGYIATNDGVDTANPPKETAFDRLRRPLGGQKQQDGFRKGHFDFNAKRNVSALLDEAMHVPGISPCPSSSGFESVSSSHVVAGASTTSKDEDRETKELYVPPKHISTVWDYHSKYGGELYTVKWESEMMIELCDSVADMAFDLINGATAQLLRQTALHTLLSAVALPYAMVNAANLIDGTWTLAVERADEAGKELARSLLYSRAGHRPVTLVGFSFGARAIYSCLKELARYQEKWETSRENSRNNKTGGGDGATGDKKDQYSWTSREPASIVEDVIVMGLPNHLSLSSWRACRQIVGGRIVNCYSRKDLILSLMFQLKRLAGGLRPVCGTCPVNVPGIENVDVSDLITSHQDYCMVAGEVLKRVRHGQPFRSAAPKRVDTSELALLGS
ncbi:Transmembrane and coiled-coil domain-containing protein 4 [Seminavis robusta]|uniref:Transmembrane and coiled-coil domain-containing protein 4 n=1 Tax=Seminavis robusta TaxID=568900 RepID=A0A9N8EU97_9STRA|nr:Transmembrane and coiled-coil domain-containing protein 4 [Seminavis robusta]|eukprot:Sro2195_g318550.1 Transmembrane and coiled-coil domain-containing protein 4 (1188) ;mRNA; r:7611-11252